ncbi:MAG: hypothetical protein E6X17_12980 [Sporomusaceae bacterium]|nr:hypothetical protein [Sporomusaceae bacterium]
MKLYIWRHNRKFHSYSMINEPNVHQDLYTDAIAIVAADSLERALAILNANGKGWLTADLARLTPQVYDCDREGVVWEEVRGS